jgi:acyl-CoA dehydrogenase
VADDVFGFLLAGHAATPVASPLACFDALDALDARTRFASSVDRAAAGGASFDRLGYAFVAGYRAALQALDPTLGRTSLCATEEGGAHPNAIQTTLVREGDDTWVLRGKKTFATLASAADTLLVVASVERIEYRNHLRAVKIPARRAGVTIGDRPPLAFAPEIPHAEITFDGVRVEVPEVCGGDGYATILKPFRTLEDAHVTAAWLGFIVTATRDPGLTEQALALIAALRAVAERDASSAETHVLLAGVLRQAEGVGRVCDAAIRDAAVKERWLRDKPLLDVAGSVRKLRKDAAWRNLARNTSVKVNA